MGWMGGGASVPSNTTNTTTVQPNQYVAPYIAPFLKQAQTVANTQYQPYTGQRVADLNSTQTGAFGQINDAVNQGNQQIGNAYGAIGNAGSMFNLGASGYTPNPNLDGMIHAAQADTMSQFQNATAPQTDAAFARSGAFGGSAWQQAQQENQRQLTQNLGNIDANLRGQDYQNQQQLNSQNYNSAQTRAVQGAALTPSLMASQLSGAQANLGVGNTMYGLSQDNLNNQYNDYLNKQNQPYLNLQTMGNAISQGMGTGGTTTQTGPNPYATNSTASLLGGAASGASLGSLIAPALDYTAGSGALAGAGFGALLPFLASDRRLKENVKRVGKTDGGLNVYTYNYKQDPDKVTHMGIMAQEAQKKIPEAVASHNGLLAVNYSKVA